MVNALPGEGVVVPVAGVDGAVFPCVGALAMLKTFVVVTLIVGSFGPGFETIALLLIITPKTLELRALCICVSAFTIGFVSAPLS
jgi:hypothetical protein